MSFKSKTKEMKEWEKKKEFEENRENSQIQYVLAHS